MLHIHRIEANDCGVEADISFGDRRTEIKGARVFGEMGFHAVEGVEQRFDGFLVGFLYSNYQLVPCHRARTVGLVRCKARFIHSVIDIVVSPVIKTLGVSRHLVIQ